MRTKLDEWYSRYPEAGKKHLAARFRSNDDQHHFGALTELIVNEALVRSGAKLDQEPLDAGTAPNVPDYRVTEGGKPPYYVEVTFSDDTPEAARKDEARKNTIYDAINGIECPDYFLGLEVDGSTTTQPSSNAIKRFLRERMDGVTYDTLVALAEKDGQEALPRWKYEEPGWSITFFPIPKKPEFRGQVEGAKPIGMKMNPVYTVVAHTTLRDELETKAKKLKTINGPLILFINQFSSAGGRESETQALFGDVEVQISLPSGKTTQRRKPNGFWWGPKGARNKHVSAVVVLRNGHGYTVAAAASEVYLNPWAAAPVDTFFTDLPKAIPAETGQLEFKEGKRLGELLGLDAAWPNVPSQAA